MLFSWPSFDVSKYCDTIHGMMYMYVMEAQGTVWIRALNGYLKLFFSLEGKLLVDEHY